MLSVPSFIPEAFCFGIVSALAFGIFVGLNHAKYWKAKLAHKNRKKIDRDFVAAKEGKF